MPAPSKAPIVGPQGIVTAEWLNYFASVEQGGGLTSFTNVTINRTATGGATVTVTTDAAALTGTTLASNVVASSLTGVGTLTSGALGPGFVINLATVTLSGAVPWVNLPSGAGTWSATPTISGTVTIAHDIQPLVNYTSNLGSINKKLLAIYAAELWVETLVAADTMATIGGRVLVAPTTELTADLTAVATTIQVKHNNLLNGHRVRLEANGSVEWMAITSAASGSAGAYIYSVTRDLDGSGANAWPAGSAVLSTGTTGDGFIDLYSVSGVLSGSGPTIVGNVRTGTTYNQIEPRWAIGNLNGLYSYASTEYGVALGVPTGAWVKIDPTNGVRIGYNTSTFVQLSTSGGPDITLGTPTAFTATSALKFTRAGGTGFGQSGDVNAIYSLGVTGDTFITIENTIKGTAVGAGGVSGKGRVQLIARGWDNSGAGSSTTAAQLDVRSEVGLSTVQITASTVSISGTLTVTGGQVSFPATQVPSADANTLDDYEEGPYTPTLKFGGGTTGITYTTQSGFYTKIGNKVTLWGEILLTSKGASVGVATITGHVHSVSASNIPIGHLQAVAGMSGLSQPHLSMVTTDMVLLDISASNDVQLTDANFSNTSRIRWTVTYFV